MGKGCEGAGGAEEERAGNDEAGQIPPDQSVDTLEESLADASLEDSVGPERNMTEGSVPPEDDAGGAAEKRVLTAQGAPASLAAL